MAGILNVQLHSAIGKKNVNFRKVEHYIKVNHHKGLDLVVLPEFFATNNDYIESFEPQDGGEVLDFIKTLAKKYNVNVVAGSIACKQATKMYNTTFAVNRNGDVIAKYNKIHLNKFFGCNEGEKFTAGNEIVIAEFDFAKVGIAVGFDVRFPAHFNKLARSGCDIIAFPCAWYIPQEVADNENSLRIAQEMWTSICKTRAYDNMVYLIVSNQTKEALNNLYGIGKSTIIAPTGEIISSLNLEECGIYANIDIDGLKYYRQLCPIIAID